MDPGIIGPGHHPWRHSLHEAVHRPETLWINKNGGALHQREPQRHGRLGAHQATRSRHCGRSSTRNDQGSHPCQPELRDRSRWTAVGWFRTLDEDLQTEAGWKRKTVAIADTLGRVGAEDRRGRRDPAGHRRPLQRVCEQGRDADFVKEPQFLTPLRTPPYYAVLGVRFCHGTEGGVKIDERMEVTGRDGRPVDGPLRDRRQHQRLGQ